MHNTKHIYIYNFDYNVRELCLLESKHVFNAIVAHKLLFSDITFNPSDSAFIKKRLDVLVCSENYDTLITDITTKNIHIEGFKIEYLVLHNDLTQYEQRLQKIRDIGHCITGEAQYTDPILTYGLCYHMGTWYFGEIIKNSFEWHNHKHKPHSFSNSLDMSMAKSLVNLATKANKKTSVLDVCCGVGTILLEGCFANNNITGSDINAKICKYAQGNLDHFNYTASIINSDIGDITDSFEAAIIDLPYNLFTKVSDDTNLHIISSTAKITDRLVIVSTTDISDLIHQIGFKVTDRCTVTKKGKKNFARIVWVCEKV